MFCNRPIKPNPRRAVSAACLLFLWLAPIQIRLTQGSEDGDGKPESVSSVNEGQKYGPANPYKDKGLDPKFSKASKLEEDPDPGWEDTDPYAGRELCIGPRLEPPLAPCASCGSYCTRQ